MRYVNVWGRTYNIDVPSDLRAARAALGRGDARVFAGPHKDVAATVGADFKGERALNKLLVGDQAPGPAVRPWR